MKALRTLVGATRWKSPATAPHRPATSPPFAAELVLGMDHAAVGGSELNLFPGLIALPARRDRVRGRPRKLRDGVCPARGPAGGAVVRVNGWLYAGCAALFRRCTAFGRQGGSASWRARLRCWPDSARAPSSSGWLRRRRCAAFRRRAAADAGGVRESAAQRCGSGESSSRRMSTRLYDRAGPGWWLSCRCRRRRHCTAERPTTCSGRPPIGSRSSTDTVDICRPNTSGRSTVCGSFPDDAVDRHAPAPRRTICHRAPCVYDPRGFTPP